MSFNIRTACMELTRFPATISPRPKCSTVRAFPCCWRGIRWGWHGDSVTKVKDLSAKTVMTTGMIMPACSMVAALNSLQKASV